jgi:hypothetical protein
LLSIQAAYARGERPSDYLHNRKLSSTSDDKPFLKRCEERASKSKLYLFDGLFLGIYSK